VKRQALEALVEEATVDAYGDEEQRTGLYTMIEEHLDLPFETKVLGTRVLVERVDMNDAGEIVAVCRKGESRQRIQILDLPMPSPAPRGAQWIAAYRYWARGGASARS
jgi:hypothetical protein